MKYILGLDLGTNSIGWYLIDEFNSIIDRGVVIFPIGTTVDKNGIEKSKNAQKREFRAAKRLLFRYKLRRKKLQKLFQKLQLLPTYDNYGNLIKTYRVNGLFQAKAFYELRKNALDNKIDLVDIGRIFLILNKYRGFKSGSKSLIEIEEKVNDEEGKVNTGIEQLKGFLRSSNSRTYGEYFSKMFKKADELYTIGKWHNPDEPYDERAEIDGKHVLLNNRGIRKEHGRYTDRSLYEKEFDRIWSRQKEFYPEVLTGSLEEYHTLKEKMGSLSRKEKLDKLNEFKKTNYWKIKHESIFYQRPLKSAKKYVSKCPFEPNKSAAPISSFIYQEFRILKQLSDLRYSDEINEIENKPIPENWRNKIIKHLEVNPKLSLRSTKKDNIQQFDLFELLSLNRKNVSFNFDNESDDKYFKGNVTCATLYQALGRELYTKLKTNTNEDGKSKLEKLWHLIYMKKDDEWLENIVLSDAELWPELAHNKVLIRKLSKETVFEDGYGTYSTKALRKLIPQFHSGLDERYALEAVGYKSENEKEDLTNWKPNNKIKNLKNGELRNPVVEKSIAEAIKLINSIITKHEIDTNNWLVRIESTRELKKPKKERESMRSSNSDKEKSRIELAKFLNEQRKNGNLPQIKSEVFKNDPLVNKFELWLELGGDKDDFNYEEFKRILNYSPEKRLKHKLWLECNRICPYTNRTINLTTLFGSQVEIEHIIPYSRSLDDSFTNKTLTFRKINKEKGNKTAYEFMKHDFKAFSNWIKKANFSKAKIENFTRQDPPNEFTHDQINNTSFIARKVREKVKEVCKEVYFTNGAVTAELRKYDWRLSGILDEIRYEEETGIDIGKYIYEFNLYKREFEKFRQETESSTDLAKIDFKNLTKELTQQYEDKTNNPLFEWWTEIIKFNEFRNKTGKKDRSDHRHHALDALITALCTINITKQLSTIHAQREKSGNTIINEKTGEILREKIDCPISYRKIKESLKNILVVNKTSQRLLVAKKNKTKKKNGFHIQKSYSVRASFHQDTFYGKLKDASLHLDNDGERLIDKPVAYVTRKGKDVWNFIDIKQLENIYDKDLKEIIKRRIEWFNENKIAITKQAYEQFPLFRYSPTQYPDKEPKNPISIKTGKPLPVVKKVRTVYKNYNSVIELPNKRIIDSENKVIELPNKKYADADGNYIMALYRLKVKSKTKGKYIYTSDFRIYSTYQAVKAKFNNEPLFQDEVLKDEKVIPLNKECSNLKQGDMVIIYEDDNDRDSILWDVNDDLKRRLYCVTELGTNPGKEDKKYGVIKLRKHNRVKKTADSYLSEGDFLKRSDTITCVKVQIDNLGNIIKAKVP